MFVQKKKDKIMIVVSTKKNKNNDGSLSSV